MARNVVTILSIVLMILLLGIISVCYSFPIDIDAPILGDEYNSEDYEIALSGNRICKAGSIICADENYIYLYLTIEDILRIPRSQIHSIIPDLPMERYIDGNFFHYYEQSGQSTKIIDFKPECKFIVYAKISEIDMFGGVDVYIDILNLTTQRLKYATFKVEYFNAVNDPIKNEIGWESFQYCKATGFIEPGTHEDGHWKGFYNTTTDHIQISTVIATYETDKQEVLQRNTDAIVIIVK